MGLRIRTNIASQEVQKNLRDATKNSNAELAKLSSGKRITKAADDAAGMAIANKLDVQVRGLRQAARNANDGISLIQTAEGGLSESSNILVRLRELTVQAASDTLGDAEREFLNMEYQALVEEVDRIAQSTTFNGAHLLNGESETGTMDFHVGTFNQEVDKIQFEAEETDASSSNIGIEGTAINSKEDANDAMENLDEAISKISGHRAKLGGIQSRLQSTSSNLEIQAVNQDSAKSMIIDTDIAASAARLASANVQQQAGISTLAQANSIPNSALRLL